MSKLLVCGLIIFAALASLGANDARNLSRYRDVTLGDSVAAVVDQLQLPASAAIVVYEQPSLVEQVTWRPHRFISGTTVAPDPLAEMVLTFHLGRLARIEAIYDRQRVLGLTDADLFELLSDVYGIALLPSTSIRVVAEAASPRHIVGGWAEADTQMLLWSEEYPRRVGLTISSIEAEPGLQKAMLEGARQRVEGEPQRARDKQAADAEAIRKRDAQIRLENKARFRP